MRQVLVPLLFLWGLGSTSFAVEPEDLEGVWVLHVDESVERALTQPKGSAMDPDQMRRIVENRAERVKLRITDSTIGLVFGEREQACQIDEARAEDYRVTYLISFGGKAGRIEMTSKGEGHFVYTSTLTDDWNWSVWQPESFGAPATGEDELPDLEPSDVHGTWRIDLDESVERLLGQPQGADFDREGARSWIEARSAARLVVTDKTIGITVGDSRRFYAYKGAEVVVYKVIFRIEAGGRQGRIELTRKGGDQWVYTSTLTPYWNWSVWKRID